MQSAAAKIELIDLEKPAATTGDGGGPPMTKGEVRKFKKLCAEIKDDNQLQAILNQLPFDRREIVYDQIAPWLKYPHKAFSELRFY